ncbi:MAG: glucose-1-phosphate adenylyltransferase [Candidatus Sumerlaeaceae bacterium]
MKKAGPNVTAVILGGGRGTRLDPLTRYRSKPAVPLAGKYRLIDVAISNCINSGIRKIYVLTQFNSASLNRHISKTYRFDDFSGGFVDILAAEQTVETEKWYQGTADAVRRQLRHIHDHEVTHYLVLSGDALYRQNFQDMIADHVAAGADISISCKMVSEREAPQLGILGIDEARQIRWFREKPVPEELPKLKMPPEAAKQAGLDCTATPFLASMGTYLFERDVLSKVLTENPSHDFGKQIIPWALDRYKVHAHLFHGYWEDIGTVRSFYQANLDLLKDQPPFDFYDPDFPIFSHARLLPCSRIVDSHIERVLVAEGCFIEKAVIRNSVIGIRSHIREGSVVEDSIVMGADLIETEPPPGELPLGIGPNCLIRNAIIDKNVRIGPNCQIINTTGTQHANGEHACIRDGVIIVLKNAVIPPNTMI